jgi:hypothetical protein
MIDYGSMPLAFYDAMKRKLLGLLQLGRARERILEQ